MFHLCVATFRFLVDCFPKPLHPFLPIVNTVDTNEGALMCEPQHAMTLKFLKRIPSLLLNGRIIGQLQVHGNVKCEAR